MRIMLFGSFYRGYHVLKELLEGDLKTSIEVIGVATDDPANSFINPYKRVWQYPHTLDERLMVRKLAESYNIPFYTGKVKSEEFYSIFEKQLKPELCLMATFGQLICPRLFKYPKYGFYNLHPCFDEHWPSYVGGNPFKSLIEDKRKYAVIAMHAVNEFFDNGELVNYSMKVCIPEDASVISLHKSTAIVAAKLVNTELKKILGYKNNQNKYKFG